MILPPSIPSPSPSSRRPPPRPKHPSSGQGYTANPYPLRPHEPFQHPSAPSRSGGGRNGGSPEGVIGYPSIHSPVSYTSSPTSSSNSSPVRLPTHTGYPSYPSPSPSAYPSAPSDIRILSGGTLLSTPSPNPHPHSQPHPSPDTEDEQWINSTHQPSPTLRAPKNQLRVLRPSVPTSHTGRSVSSALAPPTTHRRIPAPLTPLRGTGSLASASTTTLRPGKKLRRVEGSDATLRAGSEMSGRGSNGTLRGDAGEGEGRARREMGILLDEMFGGLSGGVGAAAEVPKTELSPRKAIIVRLPPSVPKPPPTASGVLLTASSFPSPPTTPERAPSPYIPTFASVTSPTSPKSPRSEVLSPTSSVFTSPRARAKTRTLADLAPGEVVELGIPEVGRVIHQKAISRRRNGKGKDRVGGENEYVVKGTNMILEDIENDLTKHVIKPYNPFLPHPLISYAALGAKNLDLPRALGLGEGVTVPELEEGRLEARMEEGRERFLRRVKARVGRDGEGVPISPVRRTLTQYDPPKRGSESPLLSPATSTWTAEPPTGTTQMTQEQLRLQIHLIRDLHVTAQLPITRPRDVQFQVAQLRKTAEALQDCLRVAARGSEAVGGGKGDLPLARNGGKKKYKYKGGGCGEWGGERLRRSNKRVVGGESANNTTSPAAVPPPSGPPPPPNAAIPMYEPVYGSVGEYSKFPGDARLHGAQLPLRQMLVQTAIHDVTTESGGLTGFWVQNPEMFTSYLIEPSNMMYEPSLAPSSCADERTSSYQPIYATVQTDSKTKAIDFLSLSNICRSHWTPEGCPLKSRCLFKHHEANEHHHIPTEAIAILKDPKEGHYTRKNQFFANLHNISTLVIAGEDVLPPALAIHETSLPQLLWELDLGVYSEVAATGKAMGNPYFCPPPPGFRKCPPRWHPAPYHPDHYYYPNLPMSMQPNFDVEYNVMDAPQGKSGQLEMVHNLRKDNWSLTFTNPPTPMTPPNRSNSSSTTTSSPGPFSPPNSLAASLPSLNSPQSIHTPMTSPELAYGLRSYAPEPANPFQYHASGATQNECDAAGNGGGEGKGQWGYFGGVDGIWSPSA